MAGYPSQKFLSIESIRDGTVILKNGGVRVILMCSSLNLALKSADEQDAIVYQYQDFLNSLDFSLQFIVHSRRLDIEPYLETLKERQNDEENELLKIQINEYVDFVRSFVNTTNVMAKTFYVVVPFNQAIIARSGVAGKFKSLFGSGAKKEGGGETSVDELKNQLWQRVDVVIAGLSHIGVRSAPLNTEELIELFYGLYNPSEFERITAPAGDA